MDAHDAIQRRMAVEKKFEGKIDIEVPPDGPRLTVRDNGAGMSEEDFEAYLSNVE